MKPGIQSSPIDLDDLRNHTAFYISELERETKDKKPQDKEEDGKTPRQKLLQF